MKRCLLITRRRIPLDQSEEYATLWHAVQDAAAIVSARAWIFESEHVAGYYTEFVEWKQDDAAPMLVDVGAVSEALARIESAFISEEAAIWSEARI